MPMPRLPGAHLGWKANRRFRHVYAIVRVNGFLSPHSQIENQVTVVRVLSDPTFAQREVERLNALHGHKNVRYFAQTTRLDLRSGPDEESDGDE